ncbi:MAG TPA: hypothetical protein VJX91_03115 [Candidatus Eisenbacteria bacterium]|nr:hypothetical protein [Candidatus Eisenbacteria bacterium]
MTDELITTLAQLGALKVISRSSTMTYKNTHEKLPAIAKALHADAVLEGSVSRSGDRVRITAQLIRAATDQNVWARSYERDIRDVLALQSDVARSIAQEIRIALSPGERARLDSPRPVDPEAHAAYLRGLDAWNRRTTVWIERAMGHFQHAIAIDPTYAAPYAGLATCYSILPAYAPARAPEALAKARAAAYKALALDSTLAEPHAALGAVKSELDFDQRGAIAEFRRAIQLNPSYASAHHWYADQLSCMGLHQKALSEIRVAKELDPLSLIIATEEGHILGRSRQYDRGIEVLRNTIAVDPGFARAHGTLGTVYRWAGRYAEAIDESQAEDSLLGTFGSREATLAWYEPIRRALRSGGSEAFYRQLLKQRLARSRKVYVPALKFVIVYAALGQRDSAFVWLDRAAEAREPDILRLKVEPSYDSLRVDPRYATLIRRLGLEDH